MSETIVKLTDVVKTYVMGDNEVSADDPLVLRFLVSLQFGTRARIV